MVSGKKAKAARRVKARTRKSAKNASPNSAPDRSANIIIELTILSLIFALVVLVYSLSEPVIADSRWSVHTAMSLIKEGNIDLNEYQNLLAANDYYMLEKINGSLYNRFPLGVSIMAVPLVLVYEVFTGLSDAIKTSIPSDIELYSASLVVAATSIFIYLIGKKCSGKRWLGLILAAIFAYSTSAWSTAGLALWQHGPTMLMLSIALYLIILARERPAMIQLAALPLSFSFIIRPSNAIPILLLSVYIFLEHRKFFLRYVMIGVLLAIPFLAFNYSIYGQVISPYYSPDRLGAAGLSKFFIAMAGNLVSPARGLFLFTPVLLMSLAGVFLKKKNKRLEKLDYFLIAIILLHWLSISSVKDWAGGHSYGPRLFSDMIPLFIYFTIPLFERISEIESAARAAAVWSVVGILALFGVFVQLRGATCSQVQVWNANPDIRSHQGRLWDYGDIPFLSGIQDNLFRWHNKCYSDDHR